MKNNLIYRAKTLFLLNAFFYLSQTNKIIVTARVTTPHEKNTEKNFDQNTKSNTDPVCVTGYSTVPNSTVEM